MIKNLVIAVLLFVVLVLGTTLVRVENERYAMSIGMCATTEGAMVPALSCVRQAQTRTSWWGHTYYAVTD